MAAGITEWLVCIALRGLGAMCAVPCNKLLLKYTALQLRFQVYLCSPLIQQGITLGQLLQLTVACMQLTEPRSLPMSIVPIPPLLCMGAGASALLLVLSLPR